MGSCGPGGIGRDVIRAGLRGTLERSEAKLAGSRRAASHAARTGGHNAGPSVIRPPPPPSLLVRRWNAR